jgi:hypothetical protein
LDPVWDAMKRVLAKLWELTCQLLHVQEWTVGGQVSTPILGLASVTVSVTFGLP